MSRVPWLAACVTLASWLLSSGMVGPGERFALLRDAPVSELFRWWSGHLVHFNAAHLRGDVLAFAIWAALVERRSRALLAVLLGVGAPLLSAAVLLSHPSLHEYRGLSALDCALVVALIGLHGREHRALALAALSLFVGKSVFEVVTGHALLAPDLGPGVHLLPLSHLFGALLGGSCVALLQVGNFRVPVLISKLEGAASHSRLTVPSRNVPPGAEL